MKNIKSTAIPKAALFLACFQSVFVGILISLDKSKEGGIFLGLSLSRLLMVILLFLIAFVFFLVGLKWGQESKVILRIEHYIDRNINWILLLLFWWFVIFFVFHFESYFSVLFSVLKSVDISNLYLGLRPIIILANLICLEIGIALYWNHRSNFQKINLGNTIFFIWLLQGIERFLKSHGTYSSSRFWKQIFNKNQLGIFLWGGALIIWLGIGVTRIGISPDDRYWNVAGVPILPQQIIFVVLLIMFLWDLQQLINFQNKKHKVVEIIESRAFLALLVFAIWFITIYFWNSQELKHTYFAPGPYPPNHERYPFSDAASFDVGSQYFLLGRGLNNNVLTDRPFLMLFIAFLHLVGGQNYETVAFVQIIFLALIPVFLFLLGYKLHSKLAGIGIAILVILKEKNAISSATQISLANPKVITSEMFNGFLLVVLTVLLIFWLENKQKNAIWPILAGGILGISIGVRVNSLFLIPIIFIATFVGYKEQNISWTKWIYANLGFLFAVALVLTPYSINNIKTNGAPFWLIKIKTAYDRSYEQDSDLLISPKNNSQKIINPDPHQNFQNNFYNWMEFNFPENFITLTLRHFVHNEIMTLLIYPLDYRVQDIDILADKPFWNSTKDWLGQLKPSEILFLGMNLLIISMGLGYSINQYKVSGVVPIILHLGYNLTNAGARTSGGRYIVPVDWVIHIYFVFGFISLIYTLRNWKVGGRNLNYPDPFAKATFRWVILVSVGFLVIGGSLMLSGSFFKPDFPINTGMINREYFESQTEFVFRDNVMTRNEVGQIIGLDSGFLASGLVLYPRYFYPRENMERSAGVPAMPDEDARLYFLFLTVSGPRHVNVSLEDQGINKFPNAEFAVVVGCERGAYIEGKVVLSMENDKSVLVVSSNTQVTCD